MQKKWYAVSVALLLLTACAPAESAVSETTPAETPTATAALSATPEQAGTRWQEQVSFDDGYTASLRDGSVIPQATLPLYYKGRWWGKTWAALAEETGLAEADLRALNPQITEAGDGTLQADTSELLLSEAYAIPQTQEMLATVTVPSMPEPYQERHYPLPAALPREAAEVLALSYYNAEAEGQGFTCESAGVGDYRQVVASSRFTTFSEAEDYFSTIYTPAALLELLQPLSEESIGEGTAYYREGAEDTLLMMGYPYDSIIPQSGYTYTEPQTQPDGSLQFGGICIVVTDDLGEPLPEGAARLYYAPTVLAETEAGWRVATLNPPF